MIHNFFTYLFAESTAAEIQYTYTMHIQITLSNSENVQLCHCQDLPSITKELHPVWLNEVADVFLPAVIAKLPSGWQLEIVQSQYDNRKPTASTRALAMMLETRDDHGNGILNGNGNPMGMGIGDKIGNWNGKEWETTCMGMGMAIIPMGINSHQRIQC